MQQLEEKLDSLNPKQRQEALNQLYSEITSGKITFPPAGTDINLHCHTFYSYNAYGYSPSKFAWLAKKTGLALAGIVDFDVLDGLDEFLNACMLLDLKGTVGLETRVYLPEFAEFEMSSPGEPGITYHMGTGFTTTNLPAESQKFLENLRKTAQNRNLELTQRVNTFLNPVQLDYEKDVLPLTPGGNPTERHLCSAYFRKACSVFDDEQKLRKFFSDKLFVSEDSFELSENASLLNLIRAKTMKRGGAGYVQPDKGSFPQMAKFNEFTLSAGAIPTLTWLDGTSSGEQQIEKLLEIAIQSGTCAINIVPDRNYTEGTKDEKLANLQGIVKIAEEMDMPIVVGTEMNSPGQKFVDTFSSDELSPFVPVFLKGAHIIYGHTVMQRNAKLGYTSTWSEKNLPSHRDRNNFFETIGKNVDASQQEKLSQFDEKSKPKEILKTIKS